MDKQRFCSTGPVGCFGVRRGTPRIAASILAMLLGACGAPYAVQPWPAEHPASPRAAEAPLPEPSRALSAGPAAPSAEGGDEGGGPHDRHGDRS